MLEVGDYSRLGTTYLPTQYPTDWMMCYCVCVVFIAHTDICSYRFQTYLCHHIYRCIVTGHMILLLLLEQNFLMGLMFKSLFLFFIWYLGHQLNQLSNHHYQQSISRYCVDMSTDTRSIVTVNFVWPSVKHFW